jgi:hypothetical protein
MVISYAPFYKDAWYSITEEEFIRILSYSNIYDNQKWSKKHSYECFPLT